MIISRITQISKRANLFRYTPKAMFTRNFIKSSINVDMQDIQKANFQAYFPKYFGLAMHQHEDIYIQEQVLGRKCYICGSTPNNFHSATYMNQIIHFLTPQQVILGGLIQQTIPHPKGSLKSVDPNFLCKPQNLYCKQILSEFLQQQQFQQPNFYFHPDYKKVLFIDHYNKRIVTNDYLTIAYHALRMDNVKISFGLPLQIIIFEDLILSHTLEQLKNIFNKTVQKIVSKYPDQYMYNPQIISQTLKHLALQHEPSLHSKQVVFLASLLRRYCKVQNKILMIVPAQHVRKIAELVHSITVRPQQVFRNFLQETHSQNYKRLQSILNDKNGIDEVLEKLAILSLLKNTHLESELIKRKNIFSNSIFAPIFNNLNMETEIYPRYKKLKQPYTQKVFDATAERMKLIENKYIHNPKRLSLTDQLKLVDDRKFQLPYTYIVDNNKINLEQNQLIQQLHRRMKIMLLQQNRTIQYKDLMDYFQGNFNKENIMVYSRVVGEAIVTMPKKPRLPVYHFGAFRGKYKEQLKNYIINSQNGQKSTYNQIPLHQKLKKLQEKFKDKINFIEDENEAYQFLTGKKGHLLKTFNMEKTQDQDSEKIPTLQQFQSKYQNIEDLIQELSIKGQKLQKEQQQKQAPKPKIKPGQSRAPSRRTFKK